MNKTSRLISLGLGLLVISSNLQAQELLRVIDKGTDGDARYYLVVCPSGKRTAVSNFYQEGKICTTPVNDKNEICRKDWNVDNAARAACK